MSDRYSHADGYRYQNANAHSNSDADRHDNSYADEDPYEPCVAARYGYSNVHPIVHHGNTSHHHAQRHRRGFAGSEPRQARPAWHNGIST